MSPETDELVRTVDDLWNRWRKILYPREQDHPEFVLDTLNPDESGSGTHNDPGGHADRRETWGPPTWAGHEVSQHVKVQDLPGNAWVEYTVTAKIRAAGAPQTWQGGAHFSGHDPMTFVLKRTDAADQVTLTLSNGSVVVKDVPLTWEEGVAYWPL